MWHAGLELRLCRRTLGSRRMRRRTLRVLHRLATSHSRLGRWALDEVRRGLLHHHTVRGPLLLSPLLLRWELPGLGTVELLAYGISLRRHPELGRQHTALATNNGISLGNGYLGILRLPGSVRLGHGTTHHGLALEILRPRLLLLGGRDRARGDSTLRGWLGRRLLGSWLRTWLNESHLARGPLEGGPRSPESLLWRCLRLNCRASMLCLQRSRSRSCGALRSDASLIRSRAGCARVGRRRTLHSGLARWSLSSWWASRGLLARELVEVGGIWAQPGSLSWWELSLIRRRTLLGLVLGLGLLRAPEQAGHDRFPFSVGFLRLLLALWRRRGSGRLVRSDYLEEFRDGALLLVLCRRRGLRLICRWCLFERSGPLVRRPGRLERHIRLLSRHDPEQRLPRLSRLPWLLLSEWLLSRLWLSRLLLPWLQEEELSLWPLSLR